MASPDLFMIAAFCGLSLVTLAHALRFRAGRLRISLSPIGGGGLCRSSKRGMSREQMLVTELTTGRTRPQSDSATRIERR